MNKVNKMGTVTSKSVAKSGKRSGGDRAGKKGFDVVAGAKGFAKKSKGRVKVV